MSRISKPNDISTTGGYGNLKCKGVQNYLFSAGVNATFCRGFFYKEQ